MNKQELETLHALRAKYNEKSECSHRSALMVSCADETIKHQDYFFKLRNVYTEYVAELADFSANNHFGLLLILVDKFGYERESNITDLHFKEWLLNLLDNSYYENDAEIVNSRPEIYKLYLQIYGDKHQ